MHWRDVTPVLSWFRGCPGCGARMPHTVVLLQLGLPVAMALTAVRLPDTWALVPYLFLTVLLAAISIVDLRIWLIPYWMPWAGAGVGLVLISLVSLGAGEPRDIVVAVAGALATFAMFFVLFVLAHRQARVRRRPLALVLGLFLAWMNPILPVYGLLFGIVARPGDGSGRAARQWRGSVPVRAGAGARRHDRGLAPRADPARPRLTVSPAWPAHRTPAHRTPAHRAPGRWSSSPGSRQRPRTTRQGRDQVVHDPVQARGRQVDAVTGVAARRRRPVRQGEVGRVPTVGSAQHRRHVDEGDPRTTRCLLHGQPVPDADRALHVPVSTSGFAHPDQTASVATDQVMIPATRSR